MLNVRLQSGLSVRELHLPHGMLSGFGRRMTSLFFGSQPSEVQETRKVAVGEQLSSSYNTASVFLLTNANLQKWHVDSANEQASVVLVYRQICQFLRHFLVESLVVYILSSKNFFLYFCR